MCIAEGSKKTDVLSRPILSDSLDSSLWNDKCDYIEIENCVNLNPNNYNLVVLQLNIRSLLTNRVKMPIERVREKELKSRPSIVM